MPRLTLNLLGPVSVTRSSDEPVALAYDKVRALLAYLVVERDRPHSRARLAALLWPESDESAARHSLSQALSSLRHSLDERAAAVPLLEIQRDTVQISSAGEFSADIHEFHRLLEHTREHEHSHIGGCRECLRRLERAVALYRGPFLEGLTLPDSEEFEAWMRSVQGSLENAFAEAVETLIEGLEQAGELAHACEYARRFVEHDPWSEAAHRSLMRLLAASGHRADAIRQYETCRSILRNELGVEPEEATTLAYERLRSGLDGPTTFDSPVKRPLVPRDTLPVLTTSFVGRTGEVAHLESLVSGTDSRLITLTGPGGIGKTRLAIEIARTTADRFESGAHFVSLSGLDSPQLLPSTILNALSAQVDPQRDSQEQLRSYLSDREMLLVLDNFEHLLDASLLLVDLLESAPGLRLLVTSRERLTLTGEWVYEVDGLSLPADGSPASLSAAGAACLFMLCARKHKASFQPTEEEGPAIARICHLTGGMPLGLELAAAWVPVLSIGEIATEIEQSLDFLETSMRDLPPRHQSIRAVLDRTWENLSGVEQRALRRLSVFREGFNRAAANYISGASLPVLSSLVGKSLLRHDEHGRYAIHELIRQYSERKLEQTGQEVDVVRDRHRDYYLGFVAVREAQLEGREQKSVLAEMTTEIENIRAAWQWAVKTADFLGLSRTTHSLWLYYEIIGHYREGASAMADAWDALCSLPRVPASQRAGYWLAVGRIRARQAALAYRLKGTDELYQYLEEAHQFVHQAEDPAEMGILLNFQACSAHTRGEYDLEARYLAESIEYFERADRRWGVAYSKNDLGHVLALRGEYFEARDLHQTALAILEELGDLRGIAFALRNLGIVASQLGEMDRAMMLLRRSVEVRRQIGNQWGIAESLNQLGVIYRDAGEIGEAASYFREALQIAREIRAMQLAYEVLDEYLPILRTQSSRGNLPVEVQERLPDWRGDEHRPKRGAELESLVDVVLAGTPMLQPAEDRT